MDEAQVHFEVMARRQHGAPWTCSSRPRTRSRGPDREEMLTEGRCVAVKVTKETSTRKPANSRPSHPEKGAPDQGKPKKPREDVEPLCVSPKIFTPYMPRGDRPVARGVAGAPSRTPFELLHMRPDRKARRVGHGAPARDPEGRRPRGAGPRHRRSRDHALLPPPGAGGHRPGAEGLKKGVCRNWTPGASRRSPRA